MSLALGLVFASTGCAIGAAIGSSTAPRSGPRTSERRAVLGVASAVRARLAARAADADAALGAAVATLAAQVRAGGSVEAAFDAVGRELDGKVGIACRGLAERLAFGEPFGEALDRWADDVDTSDAALLATTLRMHRRAGGSLAPVLEELARTMRERLEVEAELRALTAQGRMSAWIVGSLPIGFLAFLTLLTGTSIVATFATPLGAVLLVVGIGLEVAAIAWMRRILAVRA